MPKLIPTPDKMTEDEEDLADYEPDDYVDETVVNEEQPIDNTKAIETTKASEKGTGDKSDESEKGTRDKSDEKTRTTAVTDDDEIFACILAIEQAKDQIKVDDLPDSLGDVLNYTRTATLHNPSQVCFLNATMQCLANIDPIPMLIHQLRVDTKTRTSNMELLWLKAMKLFLDRMRNHPKQKMSASDLLVFLSSKRFYENRIDEFSIDQPDDPRSFLNPLLVKLSKTFTAILNSTFSPFSSAVEFFSGRRTICKHCGHVDFVYNVEPDQILNISLPSISSKRQKAHTLKECILKEFKMKQSTSQNTCTSCSKLSVFEESPTKHHPTHVLKSLPPILIISVNKYIYDRTTDTYTWCAAEIKPDLSIDFSTIPNMSEKIITSKYSLKAIINLEPQDAGTESDSTETESDSMPRKHYFAYVVSTNMNEIANKQSKEIAKKQSKRKAEKWINYDDGTCSLISEKNLTSSNGYIYWYVRDDYDWKQHCRIVSIKTKKKGNKVICSWGEHCKKCSENVKLIKCIAKDCEFTSHHMCQTEWESEDDTREQPPDKYYCPNHHPHNVDKSSHVIGNDGIIDLSSEMNNAGTRTKPTDNTNTPPNESSSQSQNNKIDSPNKPTDSERPSPEKSDDGDKSLDASTNQLKDNIKSPSKEKTDDRNEPSDESTSQLTNNIDATKNDSLNKSTEPTDSDSPSKQKSDDRNSPPNDSTSQLKNNIDATQDPLNEANNEERKTNDDAPTRTTVNDASTRTQVNDNDENNVDGNELKDTDDDSDDDIDDGDQYRALIGMRPQQTPRVKSSSDSSSDSSSHGDDPTLIRRNPTLTRGSTKKIKLANNTYSEDWRSANPLGFIECAGVNWFNQLKLLPAAKPIDRRIKGWKKELKPLTESHQQLFNKILSSYIQQITNAPIATCHIENAHSVCVNTVDSIEFQDMCQIKNNKIVFIENLDNCPNFKETIAQNLTKVFCLEIEVARRVLSGPRTQAFVLCHYTSNAHFVYATVIFEVAPPGNNSTWIVKWIYTKEFFRGLDFGKRLLQLVLKYQYTKHKKNKLILAVDTTEYNPAKAWYESLGFENDLEWGSCTGHVLDYVRKERYDSASSKVIPFQFPAGDTESEEECFLKTFQHDAYASILVYESRIKRGISTPPKGQKSVVPKMRLSKIFVTILKNILQIDASRWPTPKILKADHSRVIQKFKDASKANKETLQYIAEQTALKQGLLNETEIKLKQPTSFEDNMEGLPSFRGQSRTDPLLRAIAKGAGLRLSILVHSILETYSESTDARIKIRQHELQLLQNVSWTPMWKVTDDMIKYSADDDVPDKDLPVQEMNIYCHCCNQFLLQSSVHTLIGINFAQLRCLTPILLLKHNKLDFSELDEYKSDDGNATIKLDQDDSCYNDLLMDYHHFVKSSKMLEELLNDTGATVSVCSYLSESNMKVAEDHIDAIRADSFVSTKKCFMETTHALVYALFVADTKLNLQKQIHGPNDVMKNQIDTRLTSPTKRSDKANKFDWSDDVYKWVSKEAKGIQFGFLKLFLHLWNRSVHDFMETIYTCEQYAIAECGGDDLCYLEFYLGKYGLKQTNTSDAITWYDSNMKCDSGHWDTYRMRFDFENEFCYENPWQQATFYHNWNMCRKNSLNKKESEKMITKWFSPKHVPNVGLEFDSKLKASFMKKWKDNDPPKDPPIIQTKSKKTCTFTMTNKGGKEVHISFPNKSWELHRPLLLDKPPKDLFLDDQQGLGWDNMKLVKDSLGPMYWTARNRSNNHDKASSKKHDSDENEAITETERIKRIRLEAAEEESIVLVNRHMKYILAIVDPMTFQEKNEYYARSEIAKTLQPFIDDKDYDSTWKKHPLFIIKSDISKDDRESIPEIQNWNERAVFVVHARMLKFFDVDFLKGLVKEAKKRLSAIKKKKNNNLDFCEFRTLPDTFNQRRNTSVANYDKQFIQKVMPCSIYPKQIVGVAYSMSTTKWYRTDSCNIKDVFDDDDIFSKDVLNMLMFAHTNIEIKLGEGHRNSANTSLKILPPIQEPSLYEHPYRYKNDENKCVPGVFINLALILKCDDLATAIKLAFSEIDFTTSPLDKCIKILGTFNKLFQYKWLSFQRNSDDTLVLDNYVKATNLPIIITLYGKGSRAHCVCIFGGQIIDGLYSRSFPYNMTNLRFTLGDGEFIRYIKHGVMIKPSKQVEELYLNGDKHKNSFDFNVEGYEKIPGKNNRKRKRK